MTVEEIAAKIGELTAEKITLETAIRGRDDKDRADRQRVQELHKQINALERELREAAKPKKK